MEYLSLCFDYRTSTDFGIFGVTGSRAFGGQIGPRFYRVCEVGLQVAVVSDGFAFGSGAGFAYVALQRGLGLFPLGICVPFHLVLRRVPQFLLGRRGLPPMSRFLSRRNVCIYFRCPPLSK